MKRTSAYLFKSKYGLVWFVIAIDLHQTIISSNNQVKDTISSDVITIKGQYSCKLLQNINIFFVFMKNLFSNPVMKFLRSISYLHFVFHLAIPSDVMEPFWIKTQIHVHVTPSINKYHLKKKLLHDFKLLYFNQSISLLLLTFRFELGPLFHQMSRTKSHPLPPLEIKGITKC